MDKIAIALGHRPGPLFALRTSAMFAFTIAAINGAQLTMWWCLGEWFLLTHLLGWTIWFLWQGWGFPRARERYLVLASQSAYASVFYSHIWPGVSFGVSLMTLPVMVAMIRAHSAIPVSTMFAAVALLGAAMMVIAFRTIGLAQAGFLTEYNAVSLPLRRCGVYALIRHPLFVGGALMSVGGTLSLNADHQAELLAAINVLLLPVYRRIEDRRLIRVFGDDYERYVDEVGGVVPHINALFRTVRPADSHRRAT